MKSEKNEMHRTSASYCRNCIYASPVNGNYNSVICDYYLMTECRRGCEIGYCDKRELATLEAIQKKKELQKEMRKHLITIKHSVDVRGDYNHDRWDVRRERYGK